jgi:hypothetical protein
MIGLAYFFYATHICTDHPFFSIIVQTTELPGFYQPRVNNGTNTISSPFALVLKCCQNERGISYTFGNDAVVEFLEKNEFDVIIRAHQVVAEGLLSTFPVIFLIFYIFFNLI